MTPFDYVEDTKDKFFIHAYGGEKAAEYLRRIREALSPATSKRFEIWSDWYGDQQTLFRHARGVMGVNFEDACRQFFKKHDIHAPDAVSPYYQDYGNRFDSHRLFPTKEGAQAALVGKANV